MAPNVHEISDQWLTLDYLGNLVKDKRKIRLSEASRIKVMQCRDYLDRKIADTDVPLYGINTGFGALHDKEISKKDLELLQENLVKSHACGAGREVPEELVRLMLLLKIQALAYGHSGIQLSTLERLIDWYNLGIFPVVYEQGSLGASGDLAPLAHLSLPLLGEGEVWHNGYRKSGADINREMQWEPIRLKAKEGLALLNGTQFMSAYGVILLLHAERLCQLSDLILSLSLDAFNGNPEPFDAVIQDIRPQKGQIESARNIRGYLEGSDLVSAPGKAVQDPYSFRCAPQVHGASKDAMGYAREVMISEVNCVTDNPNIFPEENRIISGGNFHGQPLALALDFMCIAMAELGNISERRTFQLMLGKRGLPDFLVKNPGLDSGLMIPQYTAAAIVSQNKQLSTPASIDSIVSSNGQEDHVSMGANAATKAYQVIENVYTILAIECIAASQALSFRRPLRTSSLLEGWLENFRAEVPLITNDRVFYQDIERASKFIKHVEIPIP